MRKTLFLAFMLGVFAISGGAPAAAQETRAEVAAHFDFWDSTADQSGNQFHTRFSVMEKYKDFSFGILFGFANTVFHQDGAGETSLFAPIDTKLTLSYEIAGKLPVDILFGLDFNLPTGETNLSSLKLPLVMDPDLVSITPLGEGLNINPVLVLSRQFTDRFVGGLGFGYNARGEYDANFLVRDFDPGDIFSIAPELRYYTSDDMFFRLFANYSTFGTSTRAGRDLISEGDYLLLGAGCERKMGKWVSGVNISGILREDSKMMLASGGSVPVGGSDEVIVDLFLRYLLSDRTTLKSSLRFLWRDQMETGDSFITLWPFVIRGERDYFSLGFGVAQKLAPRVELEAGAKGLFFYDREPFFTIGDRNRTYYGGAAELKLTGFF